MCCHSFSSFHLFSHVLTLTLFSVCLLGLIGKHQVWAIFAAQCSVLNCFFFFLVMTGQRCIELNWTSYWLDGIQLIRPELNFSWSLCVSPAVKMLLQACHHFRKEILDMFAHQAAALPNILGFLHKCVSVVLMRSYSSLYSDLIFSWRSTSSWPV